MSGPPRPGARTLGAFVAGFAAAALLGAADPYAGFELYARVLSDIDAHAAEPPDLLRLVHASLGGMAGALDPHSAWFPPDTWGRMRAHEAGLELGIGAKVVADPCGLRVESVEPWGPAERVGLRVGDCIEGDDPARLVGREGEVVQFTARRGGEAKSYALVRAIAREPAARVEVHSGVVWLRVAHFHDPVVETLARAVPTRPAPRAFVLDLRGNPGGQVDEAARLVDRFVGSGTIVNVRQRGEPDRAVTATASRADWSQPVLVLVDGESASAAEIAAGALQKLGRARIAGRPTFGKGTVQNIFPYPDGSALKLTVGHYLLPDGRPLGAGLVPDVPLSGAPDFHSPFADQLATDPELATLVAALPAQSANSHPLR